MKCQQIIELIEEHSPVKYAQDWDNVGLLAGRRDKEVSRIMIALDATDRVVEQAFSEKADLLLTHHPLIFSPRKSVTTDDIIGRRLVRLLQSDIAYYAMHTNFDVMGMADLSAEKLHLSGISVLEQTAQDAEGKPEGIGRCGQLPRRMTLKGLAEFVKECYELDYVRICGEETCRIEKVAVSTGSGGSMIEPAIAAKVQVLISGDIDYHAALDAVAEGLCIIDAGHFGTEKMFVPYMSRYITKHCPAVQILQAEEKDIFSVI